jgi:curved DNA-binding protein CbpA
MFQFVDFYALLDIDSDATPDEINAAFNKEAKLWHPGRYPGLDGRKVMQDIIEAKRVLLDPALRTSYDIEYNRLKANKKLPPKIVVDPNVQSTDQWLKNVISEAEMSITPYPRPTYYYTVNEILLCGYVEQVVSTVEFRAPHSTLNDCKNEANRFYENRRKLIEYRISLGIYEIQNNQTFELNVTLVETCNGISTSYITRSIQKQVPQSSIDYEAQVLRRYPVQVNSWENSQNSIQASPGAFPADNIAENDDPTTFVDYYAYLELKPDATTEEIESAFRRLSIKLSSSMWHPDWHDGKDTYKRTRQINDAYKILSDAKLRAEYDLGYQKEKEANAKRDALTEAHDRFDCYLKTDDGLIDIYVNASNYNDIGFIDAVIKELGKRNYSDEMLHQILRSRKKEVKTIPVSNSSKHIFPEIKNINRVTGKLSFLQRIKRFLFCK